ncbi:MAG TPA: UDP-N-acetylmuramoyl-L-alanine--D-glutamate ligase, partial [Deltaproteobacteria bacterium]|nr:UDP-N-acetylmuramoyl-L-alanine--D-glutamate ligase [Deltaproteobacteria bacterium]
MDLTGKKIVVLGVGKTGIATAKFLGKQGAQVAVTDEKPFDAWGTEFESVTREKWLEKGNYRPEILDGASMVIPSPGVPPNNIILRAAVEKKIAVISEIELAHHFFKTPVIAVTGTNGKTTTTTLLGEILKGAGKKIFVGGNIGNPLIEYAQGSAKDEYVVAEISSFQLQWVDKFHPFISILLNITSDHTDYHCSFAEYVRAKRRIFENQTENDFAIMNADDGSQKELAKHIRAKIISFSSKRELKEGIYLEKQRIIIRTAEIGQESYPVLMIKIPGLHNVENVMAAIVAARLCGADRRSVKACVSEFHGLPHRIEFAGEKNSIKFYDDSKGTNVGAVVRALETFSQPVVLLLGGRDKEGDFETLQSIIPEKTKRVILFGEAKDRIASLIGNSVEKIKTQKLIDAVEAAYKSAEPGDIVLLSPGCA